MSRQKYVGAELEIVKFHVLDVIATSNGTEVPSTSESETILPSTGPNDTEIL